MIRATVKIYDHSLHSQIIIEKIFLFFVLYKNGWKEREFWRQKNKKNLQNFYKNKQVIKIDDIDVNKILVSKEKPDGSTITPLLNHYA